MVIHRKWCSGGGELSMKYNNQRKIQTTDLGGSGNPNQSIKQPGKSTNSNQNKEQKKRPRESNNSDQLGKKLNEPADSNQNEEQKEQTQTQNQPTE